MSSNNLVANRLIERNYVHSKTENFLKFSTLKMKVHSNDESNNEVNFSALPGGYRYKNGNYYGLGSSAHFWTSTEYGTGGNSWYRLLSNYDAKVFRSYDSKNYCFSVRCVRD